MSKYPHQYVDSKGIQHDIESLNDSYLLNAYRKIERKPKEKRSTTQMLALPYLYSEIQARNIVHLIDPDSLPKLKLPGEDPNDDF